MSIKLLIHIDQSELWGTIQHNLINMMNAKKDTHPDLAVEVVVTGEAALDLMSVHATENLADTLKQATDAGFEIKVCNNSLKRYHSDSSQLLDYVQVVPAGLIEIATKEAEGWSYVKP